MNPILSKLQEGPKPYHALRGLLPVYQLDAVLKNLLQTRQIRVTTRGFDLPAKCIEEEERREPESHEMICVSCDQTKPKKTFRTYKGGTFDPVCNSCRHRRNGRLGEQKCYDCKRVKPMHLFHAMNRNYARGRCIKCELRHRKKVWRT